jgi:pimeloyl-ACP methyl ester carboxylesterase
MNSISKKAKAKLLPIFIIIAFLLLPVGILLFNSSGNPQPFLDENGVILPNSLSEKIFVEINGVKQGMFIKSKDVNHPVLLYLHGGMPDYFLSEDYPTQLEENFTVVWWEQRGSGISFDKSIEKDSITDEQLIEDTVVLTNYLRERFHQEKIYLMGHSGGTYFGIQAAAQNPELFYAYIAVAQITDQLRSEMIAREYMISEYSKLGNVKMVEKLNAAPVTMENGASHEYQGIRDNAMHALGIGTMHNMHSILYGLFLPSLRFKEYSLSDKFNLWRAKIRNGISVIWEKALASDLRTQVTHLDIPIYFFEGIYDYTCNYSLAKDYFNKIEAPVKGFYTFQNSAHSPIFEEPDLVEKIMREDVLNSQTTLADNQ